MLKSFRGEAAALGRWRSELVETLYCTAILENLKQYDSFDFLRFHSYRLIVHKDSLSLVRLRLPPFSDLCCKLSHHLLLTPFQQYSCGLRYTSFDTKRYWHLDRMRISQFQGDELLSGIFPLFGDCGVLNCSSVANTDKT